MVNAWSCFDAFYDDRCLGQGLTAWRVFELIGTEVLGSQKNSQKR